MIEFKVIQKCDHCGKPHQEFLKVVMAEKTYTFDCFDCAIQTLAPICPQCHCRIIGVGYERNHLKYCSRECLLLDERLEQILRKDFISPVLSSPLEPDKFSLNSVSR